MFDGLMRLETTPATGGPPVTHRRWLLSPLLLMGSLAVRADSPPPDFLANNLAPAMFHSAEDYLADLPEETLSRADREKLLASGNVTMRDGVTDDGKSYYANYQFVAPGLVVRSGVHVVESEAAAKRAADDMLRGALSAHDKRGAGNSMLKIPSGTPFDGTMLVWKDAAGELLGNSWYLWRGRNVYTVSLAGAGAFVTPEDAAHFVATKADAMLHLVPDVGQLSLGEAQRMREQGRDMGLLLMLSGLYTLAYWVGKFAGVLLAKISARLRGTEQGFGIAAVLLTCGSVIAWMMSLLDRGGAAFRRLTPFDQGEMEGEIMGTALFPALVVLGVMGLYWGYARSRRRGGTV